MPDESRHRTKTDVPGEVSLRRLERLSDIIYAVGLLLLLANVAHEADQTASAGDFWQIILSDFEVWSGFVISFVLIAIYWITHQKYFSYYIKTDTTHTFIELIYLMFLVFMPFGNFFMASYPDTYEPLLLVSLDMAAVGIVLAVTWTYATHNNRLIEAGTLDHSKIAAMRRDALVLPLIAAIAALYHPALWVAVFIVGLVVAGLFTVRQKQHDGERHA